MNSWEQFCNGFKDFINQPLPMILFTSGACLFFALSIISKTSIGKKSLNTLKEKINGATKKLNNATDNANNLIKEFNEYKECVEQEKQELVENYEIKLGAYHSELVKLNDIIKVLCENSPNKNIKLAYENFEKEIKELNVSDSVLVIQEEVKEKYENEYGSKLNALIEEVERLKQEYGKQEE